ncbi:MAG TPA: PIN domain-containing protein [Solirubrobacteraceae bacterium]|nr:PIN domain-containing protein [Solirubrobacteraceae bacterium]
MDLLGSILEHAFVGGTPQSESCPARKKGEAPRRQEVQALSPAAIEVMRSAVGERDATLISVLAYAGTAGWGQARMLRMEAKIHRVEVVHSGPELVAAYAQLRAECEAADYALGHKAHTGDRWIAATAIRLGIPLVSNDGIFRGAPGLQVETLASDRASESRFRMYPSGTRARLCRSGGALLQTKVPLCRTSGERWS